MLDDTIKLLSLESYRSLIESITVLNVDDTLHCEVNLKRQVPHCVHCGSDIFTIHDYRVKAVIHSVHAIQPCILIIRYRRLKCKFCGQLFSEVFPISDYKQRISKLTKLNVLDQLRDPTKTFTAVSKLYGITTQTTMDIFDQFVQPRRLLLPEYICMDEFYLGKRSKNKYACVLLDFQKKQIIEVFDTRHKLKLTDLLFHIPLVERSQVKAVIIDMWVSYKDVIARCFPNALIAVDAFHVIWHMNKAMTDIRIRVMNRYRLIVSSLEANDMYYYMLKKFYFFFLVDYEKLKPYYRIPKLQTNYSKDNLLHYLLSIDEELKAAYLLKEAYRYFSKTADFKDCQEQLDSLIKQFKHSKSEEMKQVGKMLNNWKSEIINSFIKVERRRLSNGPIENMNSQIKTIIKSSNGYRDFSRLRNRIMYSLNKDTPIKG